MKKLYILCVALIIVLFCACSGDTMPSNSMSVESETGPPSIVDPVEDSVVVGLSDKNPTVDDASGISADIIESGLMKDFHGVKFTITDGWDYDADDGSAMVYIKKHDTTYATVMIIKPVDRTSKNITSLESSVEGTDFIDSIYSAFDVQDVVINELFNYRYPTLNASYSVKLDDTWRKGDAILLIGDNQIIAMYAFIYQDVYAEFYDDYQAFIGSLEFTANEPATETKSISSSNAISSRTNHITDGELYDAIKVVYEDTSLIEVTTADYISKVLSITVTTKTGSAADDTRLFFDTAFKIIDCINQLPAGIDYPEIMISFDVLNASKNVHFSIWFEKASNEYRFSRFSDERILEMADPEYYEAIQAMIKEYQ